MATRPAWAYKNGAVVTAAFAFDWNGGFALSQKQKNIAGLHAAIARRFGEPALEISTKSTAALGRALSAFNLKTDGVPLECVFQASKVFSSGGPYPDLLTAAPREAKRDERLRSSGPLTGFAYAGHTWPLTPRTAFYDWLYVRSALETFSAAELAELDAFVWFTDIEFNPERSINCQARAAALLKAALREGKTDAVKTPEAWLKFHKETCRG